MIAVIDCRLPSLNEYIDVCRRNKYQAAQWKASVEEQIGWFIKGLPKFTSPVWIDFHWIEPNKKRDPDNIVSAKKYILDALVNAGVIPNDTMKWISGFTDTWSVGERSRVIIDIKECENNDNKGNKA